MPSEYVIIIYWSKRVTVESRGSTAGILTGLRDRRPRIMVRIPADSGLLSLLHSIPHDSAVHQSCCPMSAGRRSPGLNRPGAEVDYLPPHSFEIKKEWSNTSTFLSPFVTFTGSTLP